MTVKANLFYINKLLSDPKGPVGKQLRKTGIRVHNKAKRYCPVDTGRLRSSIRSTQPFEEVHRRLVVRVGTNVDYAAYVELGTRYMSARPFLRRALNEEVR